MDRCVQKYLLFNKLYACAAGYKIIHRRVSCISDIEQTIDQLNSKGNKIYSLWILAHGDFQGISLVHEDINAGTLSKLKNSLQKLEANATIVLAACNAGYLGHKLSPQEKPIAAHFAAMVPGRKVYAPGSVLFDKEINIYMNKSSLLKGVFYNPWTNEKFTRKFKSIAQMNT